MSSGARARRPPPGRSVATTTTVAIPTTSKPREAQPPAEPRAHGGDRDEAGRGKRGGVRVYYLDLPRRRVTHLMAIFGKRERADLTPAERRQVVALVKELKKP